MSAVMMLRHLAATHKDPKCEAVADRIRDAYNACLIAGEKTRDLDGSLGTREFADAIIKRLGSV
jgi:isocitrate/isopropylmalate dehydrogenase